MESEQPPEVLPPSSKPAGMDRNPANPECVKTKRGLLQKKETRNLLIFVGVAVALTVAIYYVRSGDPDAEIPKSQVSRSQKGGEATSAALVAGPAGRPVPGVSDGEMRLGIVGPFTGPSKELGREMALGLNAAFDQVNDTGGVAGRRIKLMTADDGYEPTRTANAVEQLHLSSDVMGYVGNVGTPTAAVALPYALQNHMLFFGAFTGAESLRTTPPDRYVFNYRPSYAEETAAVVQYLVKVRGIPPQAIAVFAQADGFGDSGYNGVVKAMRALGAPSAKSTLRMNYVRNSLDLTDALRTLHARQRKIRAVVMVASYRPAAKFIEKVRPENPDLIFTNVSFVGSTALADELRLLGPTYMDNVIVTQTVPAVSGYSTVAMEYRAALQRYFPGEAPDYVSFEGFVDGRLLVEGLRRVGHDLSTESLVNTLEKMQGLELGLGTPVSFGPSEHQASHRIWATQLERTGNYKALDLE